ncbi:MAG: beta-ketoacyl-ACP synthase II [Sandaracinaceae bacterium]
MTRRVVVTGVGAVSPCGPTMDRTWGALMEGRSGIAPLRQIDTTDLKTTFGGECADFDPDPWWNKTDLRRHGRFTHLSVAATAMAAEMAGLETANDGDRGGTFIGVALGGLPEILESQATLDARGPRRVSPFFILQAAPNLAAGEVALRWGLRGVSFATASACTSGSHAIGEAFHAVRDGRVDYCFAGGAEAVITRLTVAGFNSMRALSVRNEAPTEASRPFDAARDGFVLGEGAATLVLETEERAKARGATILAEIRGYGASTDAVHATKPPDDGAGLAAAMKEALTEAELAPRDVDYVNPHATSTPAGDAAEAEAILSVFGEHARDGLLVSATKSMTGHLLGAAGALEAAIAIYAIRRGEIPPTLNIETPEGAAAHLDLVPREGRRQTIRAALSNSTGFGGHNASIAFAAPR